MKRILLYLFAIISLGLFAACEQSPDIEGRWVFVRQDTGDMSPAKTYEFLDGQLKQGFAENSFSNLQLVGEYSFLNSTLQVKSDIGISITLISISDHEVVLDVSDNLGATARVAYCRP